MKNREITFRASKDKVRKVEKSSPKEKSELSWIAKGAKTITLDLPNCVSLTVSNNGKYVVSPEETTTYCLHALFPDGEEQIKHIQIEVLPPAKFSYDVVEKNDGENLYAEFVWLVKDAKNITVDNTQVDSFGFKKYLIDRTITVDVKYQDAFGNYTQKIYIVKENKSIKTLWNIVSKVIPFFGPIGRWEVWIHICFFILFSVLIVIMANNVIQTNAVSVLDGYIIGFYDKYSIYIASGLYLWVLTFGKSLKAKFSNFLGIVGTVVSSPLFIHPLIVPTLKSYPKSELVILIVIVMAISNLYLACVVFAYLNKKTESKYEKIKVWKNT